MENAYPFFGIELTLEATRGYCSRLVSLGFWCSNPLQSTRYNFKHRTSFSATFAAKFIDASQTSKARIHQGN